MTELRHHLQTSLGATYRIERELGGGGMSRVFVAEETSLGRQVVVKVLRADAPSRVSVKRFQREIGLVAGLQHPHIVPLLTAGELDGVPYFTMPLVEGETLRVRLDRAGELPVAHAIRLLREVASALATRIARASCTATSSRRTSCSPASM
jgi:serine/threonine-protein kinase